MPCRLADDAPCAKVRRGLGPESLRQILAEQQGWSSSRPEPRTTPTPNPTYPRDARNRVIRFGEGERRRGFYEERAWQFEAVGPATRIEPKV